MKYDRPCQLVAGVVGKRKAKFYLATLIDLIHDGRYVGFAIIIKISYTLLRGQTTQVREVITNILALFHVH